MELSSALWSLAFVVRAAWLPPELTLQVISVEFLLTHNILVLTWPDKSLYFNSSFKTRETLIQKVDDSNVIWLERGLL